MIPDYAGFRFGIILFQNSYLFHNHLLQKKATRIYIQITFLVSGILR